MEVKAAALGGSASPAGLGAKSSLDGASLTDPLIVAQPSEFYRSMRKQDPVYYDEKIGMYLVSRYDDVAAVLRDPITFSDKLGYEALYASGYFEEFKRILEADGGGFFPDAIKDDPPAHTRVRRLMEQAFTAHRVATLEPGITAIVVDLIEKLADKAADGELVDGVNDFAVPLTIAVICEQLGIHQVNAHKIQRWSQAITAQISHMQDRKLTFPEAVSLIRALIIAGNETTATAVGNLLFVLATQPDVAKMLRDSIGDERLLARFVEELLRIEPPVRGLAKMTTREVELGGRLLPDRAHLLVLYASGNDDESVFECPRRFDMNRSNLGKHVAFGVGVHRCIGASLAAWRSRLRRVKLRGASPTSGSRCRPRGSSTFRRWRRARFGSCRSA